MFTFSLTNDQKRVLLVSTANNLEMELYSIILSLGENPDTYDFSKIDAMVNAIAPSNEHRLYTVYNRMKDLQARISTL